MWRELAFAVCVSALVAGCGGGSVDEKGSLAAKPANAPQEPGRPVNAARLKPLSAAATVPDADIDRLFDWAEWNWKDVGLFQLPSESRQHERGGFELRGREYAGAFLGVTSNGDIYGQGTFSNGVLMELGHITDFSSLVAADACYVRPGSCAAAPPRIRGLSLISNTIAAGWPHQLSVDVEGTPPFSYQWLLNGTPVAGQTGSSFSIARATPSDSGAYTVTVRNAAGVVTSGPSFLSVSQGPALRYFTSSGAPYVGQQFELNVTALTTIPPSTLTYRFYRNGQLLASTTSSTYVIPSLKLADGGVYWVEVINQYGTTRSEDIVLTVLQAPPSPLPTWRLQGTVGNGKAVADAVVTVRCSNGSKLTGQTDSVGRFDIAIGEFAADPAPCLVEVRGGAPTVTLRSYARTSGVVNINPLTDLTILKALGADTPALYVRFGTSVTALTTEQRSAIADAAPFVQGMMETISGGKANRYGGGFFLDPFSSDFQLGDDRDRLFRALNGTLTAAAVSYAHLQQIVLTNAGLRESFRGALYDELNARIVRSVSSITCTLADNSREVVCVVRGRNLTLPMFNPLFDQEIDSDVGIAVSLINDRLPKVDPTKPWSPSWCTMSQFSQARSTDSDDPTGPDPLSMYAEELTFHCRNSGATLRGSYTAEATVDGGLRVIGESAPHGTDPATPTYPQTGGTIRIESASCRGSQITVTGSGTIAANSVVNVGVAIGRPTDLELENGSATDLRLAWPTCSHAASPGPYCLPSSNREMSPMTFSAEGTSPRFGIEPGMVNVSAWMFGYRSYDPPVMGVVARADVSVFCDGSR